MHAPDDGDRPVDDDALPEDPDEAVTDEERPVVLDEELDAPAAGLEDEDVYPEYAVSGGPDEED